MLKLHESITVERLTDAHARAEQNLDNPGICVICGADADGVEPDARKYRCEDCGNPGVYGVEELLIHVAL